jgi:hypothetical protein
VLVSGGEGNGAVSLNSTELYDPSTGVWRVTDEEENESIKLADETKTRFFQLFMKYREEVYPAKLVFISFLAHQHDQGQMYKQFQQANVPDVIQVRQTLF